MKITKNRLRQIIKEELENVLSEKVDLENLAGMIILKNEKSGSEGDRWLGKIWTSKLIYQDTATAFSEMLMAAWSHWSLPGRSLRLGLSRENLAILKSAEKQISTIRSAAQSRVVPMNAGEWLKVVPANKTPDAAIDSSFGRTIGLSRGGGAGTPFDDDDDL